VFPVRYGQTYRSYCVYVVIIVVVIATAIIIFGVDSRGFSPFIVLLQ
jgi:hypothetical protein